MGRFVRLDLMSAEDAEPLHAVHADPVVYSQGYVMPPPSVDLAATRALVDRAIAARRERPHGIHGAAHR